MHEFEIRRRSERASGWARVGVIDLALLALLTAAFGHSSQSAFPRPDARKGAAPSSVPLVQETGEAASAAPHVQSELVEFSARIDGIGPATIAKMGTSWKPGCPVPLEDLRVISMPHWDFEGRVTNGELMVHERYAAGIVGVFRALFEARYPIARMELANGYMGNDPPLAQRNNTVGFNCRPPVGGGLHAWSEHSFGRAVDLNPDQNPYVSRSGRIEPPFGQPYVDRSLGEPGMIRPGDPVVRAFAAIGWRWGGDWPRTKDYMHFSATGR